MEMVPQPAPGFSPAALKELWQPDEEVMAICQGCPEAVRGDCCYAGDRSARVMCRVIKKELGS